MLPTKAIICTAGLVALSLLLPAVPAPTTPTPGWVVLTNDLVLTEAGCLGGTTQEYTLKPVDVAARLRITYGADCSIDVTYLVPTIPDPLSANGFVVSRIISDRIESPRVDTSITYAAGCPNYASHTYTPATQSQYWTPFMSYVQPGSAACGEVIAEEMWSYTSYPSIKLLLTAGGGAQGRQICKEQWYIGGTPTDPLGSHYCEWDRDDLLYYGPEQSTFVAHVLPGTSVARQIS